MIPSIPDTVTISLWLWLASMAWQLCVGLWLLRWFFQATDALRRTRQENNQLSRRVQWLDEDKKPDEGSAMSDKKRQCACVADNPRDCWTLRYYGIAGLGAPSRDDYECECTCHDDEGGDYD